MPLVTQIDRYVFRQLAVALVAVTGGLTALIWLTQSLRFVEMVVNRGLSMRVFIELTGLLIPSFVAVILPITTYVVIQFIYQRLLGDRELTVMRAAGLSHFALARPALGLVAVSLFTGYLLNLWLVPISYTAFREYQFEIRNRIAAFLLQEGVFTKISEQLTVYVRSRERDGTLHGILVDDGRQENHATILAESGRLIVSDTAPPRVVLLHGSRQEIDRQTGRLNVLTFSENTVELLQAGSAEVSRFRDPEEQGLAELLNPNPQIVSANLIGKFKVEAHKRLAGPLTTVSFALVGLVSVLLGTFRRHGGLIRPTIAVLTVVGLLALQLAVSNLAARNIALVPLIWIEAALPALVAAWVLFGPRFGQSRTGRRAFAGRGGAAIGGATR